MVPKPEYSEAGAGEVTIPSGISPCPLRFAMLPAVDFDDQSSAKVDGVQNVITSWSLSPKMARILLVECLELKPQLHLMACHRLAHASCTVAEVPLRPLRGHLPRNGGG